MKMYIAKTLYGDDDDEEDTPKNNNTVEEPKFLGLHPSSNEKVLLKNGPYGYYVQLGEDRKGYSPKRASVSQLQFCFFSLGYWLPPNVSSAFVVLKRALGQILKQIKDVGSVTLEAAIELLRYPVTLGNHPEDGHPVVLKLARFGFTIRHRHTIASVPKNLKPNDITLERALRLLNSKDVRRCGRPKNKPRIEEAIEAF
ncbi:unnamed protein product [Thlaspi arvense]|uniref:Uncharacterized protein n=1 Tax=Thlaspi arvense TaxID=13288 RepID=A0AAU9SFG7_THLAR|nr:unnamed protein product [Thlaspi arvense]